jgi:hypothetical protein
MGLFFTFFVECGYTYCIVCFLCIDTVIPKKIYPECVKFVNSIFIVPGIYKQ